LVELEVGVRGDDRTRRKVYSFSHEVTSESTFFTLQTRSNGLNWLSGLVLLLSRPLDIVIHHRGNEELEDISEVFNGRVIVVSLESPLNLVVLLDDLLVGHSQVVLTAHRVGHCHRWTHRRGSHCQVEDDHVGRIRSFLAETHHLQMLGTNFAQNSVCLLRPEHLLGVVVGSNKTLVLDFVVNAQGAALVLVVFDLTLLALLQVLRHLENRVESTLRVLDFLSTF